MCKYSEKTLRKRARAAGYKIEKGFQHNPVNGAIWTYWNGERETGYLVTDLATNSWVYGSFDEFVDHAWTLEDVENFLKNVYESHGLEW